MKAKITKAALLAGIMGVAAQSFAQETAETSRFAPKEFRTWSVGVHAGVMTPRVLLTTPSKMYSDTKEHVGYGAYIKKQFFPSFGVQAEFLGGKVEQQGYLQNGSAIPNSGYKTSLQWSAALTAVYNIANISYNNEWGMIIPYVKAGAGYLSGKAETSNIPGGMNPGSKENWFIPVGAGVKIAVSKGINLDLGYDVNFVRSQNFDGVATGNNDRFAYGHAGLEFALGKKEQPQLQSYSAIASLRKASAEESAELRNMLSTAEQRAQREREQYAKDLGDDDGDGVANKFDKCPGTPAGTTVDGSGCPMKTPTQVTKVVVTDADRKVVRDAINNLEFDLGKSTIRAKSYPTLDRVAALLVEKNFSLKLAGHTDNTGSKELNMRLSKDRAESVKSYLVSKGANASRIEATGYGPDQPIATNKTAAGRQQNRRVEFTLY